jgi:hypothetical protein
MAEISSSPIATLYVFQKRGRPVAIAIGQAPPDPHCVYDALLRIPIMANGDRPAWRAFVWHQRETMQIAMKRSLWPEDDEEGNDE